MQMSVENNTIELGVIGVVMCQSRRKSSPPKPARGCRFLVSVLSSFFGPQRFGLWNENSKNWKQSNKKNVQSCSRWRFGWLRCGCGSSYVRERGCACAQTH
jgi:hypothetical protein